MMKQAEEAPVCAVLVVIWADDDAEEEEEKDANGMQANWWHWGQSSLTQLPLN